MRKIFRIRGKQIAILFLVFLMVVAFVPMSSMAATVEHSGTSGTVKWELDSDGVLTFSPTSGNSGIFRGESGNSVNNWGWLSYKDDIKSVKFTGGTIYGASNMRFMFSGCKSLTTLDVSGFKTDNVTNMSDMFYGCKSLTTLDVSGFKTDNVTNMSGMFQSCKSLTTLDVSGFKTDNVTNMRVMFYGCESLTTLDVSGFKTDNVTNMRFMFSGCESLTTLDVSGFKTDNVTDMRFMFSGCESLTTLDVSGFKTDNVADMSGMFYSCESLTTLNLSSFRTHNVKNMQEMFGKCKKLKNVELGEHFSFSGGGITDSSKKAIFPDGHKWTNGTLTYTAEELRDNYEPSLAGTWSWDSKRTLTWDYGDGKTKTEYLEPGENIAFPKTPTKDGYVFSKWVAPVYLHTPNIDNNGIANGTYSSNYENTDVVTVEGASKLKIDVYYSTESPSYDWLAIYDKDTTPSDSNYNDSISGKLGGGESNTKDEATHTTVTVNGDTAQFYFRSDELFNYYGYYAIVTGLDADGNEMQPQEAPPTMPDRDLTLVATWGKAKVTVNLDANGGVCDTLTKEVVPNEAYGELPTPTREGYEFKGWYTAETGGTKVNSTDIYTGDQDQTLYAHWERKMYKLTVKYTGDDTKTETHFLFAGEEINYEVTTPTRRGYVFSGWDPAITKMPAEDTTITATWERDTSKWDESGSDITNEDDNTTHPAGTYLVTIPASVQFAKMDVGEVDANSEYNVNVKGIIDSGSTVKITAETDKAVDSSGVIKETTTQGKMSWNADECYGNLNDDGSITGTDCIDNIRISGLMTSVGVWTGAVRYRVSLRSPSS